MLGFLEGIIDIADLYGRYGIKGCALMVVAILVGIGLVIVVASFMQ